MTALSLRIRAPLRNRLRISELSRRADVSHATIQFYVREGLLPQPAKTGRTMAYYDEECVERIALIKELRRRYLPLNVIRKLLDTRIARGADLGAISRGVENALAPTERALSREEVVAQFGLTTEVLAEIEAQGIVRADKHGQLGPYDVAILRALAKLSRAGLNRDAGFEVKDILVYQIAVQSLVAEEVSMFLQRATRTAAAGDVTRLAVAAATYATELIVALRQKTIADALGALPKGKR